MNKTMLKQVFAVMAILGVAPLSAAPQAAPQFQITPANGYYSSGPQGGSFNPGVQIFTMTNTGTATIGYTVSANQPWVTVFMTSGTLDAGNAWANPVFINSQANTLAAGTYTATVTFTNTTNGSGNTTRVVTLIVGAAGDTTPPTVTITNPVPPNATSPTASVTVSGTASDNTGITSMYWVNMLTNEQGTMAGATAWTFSVGLINGDNQIHVLAWDGSGNQGTASIIVHYGPVTGAVMSVTPATGFSASGPAGGPFSPLQQVYTVSNTGTSTLNFTATAAQPWLNVLAGTTSLAPGASGTVILSFTAAANSLAAGNYSDTVTFTNTTNAAGNTTRSVNLVVGSSSDTTPPSIAITTPAPPSATASSSPLTISGTASDNVGVASISWNNAEALQSGTVPGGNSWTINMPLVSGTNTITITAHDAGGNSASATLVVTMGAGSGSPAASTGGGGKGHHCLGATAVAGGNTMAILILGVLLAGIALRRR
ncbi:MAG TPA: Ig-like domain-containing protein [Planctomycetota bacterium]|nr:Ig-like domain-containing protein [Planctomycetota bacterium]